MLRRIAPIALAAVALLVISPAPAFAAGVVTAAAATAAITFTLPPALIVGLIGSVVLPIIVGWVSNSTWSSRGKAILLAALAGISGFVTELGTALTNGVTYDAGLGLLTAVGLFLGSVGVYFGFLSRPGKDGTSVASKLAKSGGVTIPPR